ncbi:MAG TPA: branched-chain amino acid aminotransferase [Azospirillaceae bacterium]|mgnify:CR=1 FL=1|nr:branched-chain amino acid aminotransferase [Azospirillaceae bacterium]
MAAHSHSPTTGLAAVHYIDGRWESGNPPVVGPMTHGLWMASTVFDGARAFEDVTPDLDLHCARVTRSALAMGLNPTLDAAEIEKICREGVAQFPKGAELYIRPVFYAETGFVAPDPDSTKFICSLFVLPMPPATGFSAALSSRRRPSPEMAPTLAKASCLYPNAAQALTEARGRGFDNALLLDPLGNIAEFATANIFIVKDGAALTPSPNGTFLDGITRRRVIGLLRGAGVEVVEKALTWADVLAADEVFSTGNYGKVMPATRMEDREYPVGPVASKARALYWDFAHGRL